jgi:DNA polymerase-3 subunit beta
MKVSLLSDLLQKKLSFVNHAVSSKSQLPVLLNILFETRNNELVLSSTDLEIGIETTVAAQITEEGSITIPARTFTELVSSLAHAEISLETKETSITVKSARTRSSFQTLPKEDFPRLYEDKGKQIAVVNTKQFRLDIQTVVFAAGTDAARPALSGVLVRKDAAGGLLLVATDGYRLSLKQHILESDKTHTLAEGESLIVPARVFRETAMLKDEAEHMSVFITEQSNQIMFEAGETLLLGRLISGEFPNYDRIIPSDFSATATFDREEMLKAVKICSIFARDSANIIKFSLKTDKIIVSSTDAATGENTVEIESTLKGEENEIAFNARYLLEFLSNNEATTLTFEMVGPLNPGVFRVENDTSFLHLIMPIRIQD